MVRRVTDAEIAKVYEKKLCNISATCSALGINRLTFYRRREKSKTLQKLLEEAEESLLDWAETKLISHIEEGDITTLLFFLKTKGKKRGYIEKVENDVSINGFEELMRSLPVDDD